MTMLIEAYIHLLTPVIYIYKPSLFSMKFVEFMVFLL